MVKVLQVVGFKKSGKTTTMNRIIKQLKAMNYEVSVIKHHGEIGGQEIDIPRTRDHITYIESGADESIVQGYTYIHKLRKNDSIELQTIIDEEVTCKDIVLVEGYKQAHYDKIVLYNKAQDKEILSQLQNIKIMVDTSVDSEQVIKKFIQSWVGDIRETI
ncbi:molybdopterin-guanine dinucleotide biosynthesis protein B [Macrococcus armenti]|uniref:molybdopterin-guanine dinucleotide biosynthesis protein B n=1 Tax=Macrococcus armenti TaxID=2875764 RepID=UPI001CCDC3EC|nr:molybdopterin-guanine dinucleotide biosynthesis protein B [Macrococcus armenti]UBH15520.1 molybdopterin-guanine dinucleotide biosynthesis protein B [Macrococcus armenti]UBH17880.1 molybdopterin-guanine dinucleotide biosynthesis protein B [Macrococcus armenti]UBH20145.1 molybdopterin-guanine dinucleotide biosynthesis protein B [Macrococcus armenti]